MFSNNPNPGAGLQETIVSMSHGNFGAATALAAVVEAIGVRESPALFSQLREMNIVGTNLWLAYKFGCNFDVSQLVAKVRANDVGLVSTINRYAGTDNPAQLRS